MRFRAAAALVGALFISLGCDRGEGTSTGVSMLRGSLDLATGNGVVIELDLSHGLTEQAAPLSLFGSAAPSHAEVVQAFTRAKTDRRTRGFFVRLGGSELSWAQAEELGRLFAALEPIFNTIRECEDGRDVKALLNGPVAHSGFTRLN